MGRNMTLLERLRDYYGENNVEIVRTRAEWRYWRELAEECERRQEIRPDLPDLANNGLISEVVIPISIEQQGMVIPLLVTVWPD